MSVDDNRGAKYRSPSTPMNILGPSILADEGPCKAVEGTTVRKATWSWRTKEGASKDRSVSTTAVRHSTGAR